MLLLAVAVAAATAMMPVPVKKWVVDTDPLGRAASPEGSAARVEVTIDSAGQPVHCEVTLPDKAAGFNRAACHALMRGPRLAPGRDADGAPIAAVLRYDFSSSPLRNPLVRPARLRAVHDAEARRLRDAAERTVDFAIPVSRLPEAGKNFTADVVLLTDDTGRVSTCNVATSSGAAQLDRLACTQMGATAFEPARDGQGQPLRAVREVSVGFIAPPAD